MTFRILTLAALVAGALGLGLFPATDAVGMSRNLYCEGCYDISCNYKICGGPINPAMGYSNSSCQSSALNHCVMQTVLYPYNETDIGDLHLNDRIEYHCFNYTCIGRP